MKDTTMWAVFVIAFMTMASIGIVGASLSDARKAEAEAKAKAECAVHHPVEECTTLFE